MIFSFIEACRKIDACVFARRRASSIVNAPLFWLVEACGVDSNGDNDELIVGPGEGPGKAGVMNGVDWGDAVGSGVRGGVWPGRVVCGGEVGLAGCCAVT